MNPVIEFLDQIEDDFQQAQMDNANEDNVIILPLHEVQTILSDIREIAGGNAKLRPKPAYLYCAKCGEKIQTDLVWHWQRKHGLGKN